MKSGFNQAFFIKVKHILQFRPLPDQPVFHHVFTSSYVRYKNKPLQGYIMILGKSVFFRLFQQPYLNVPIYFIRYLRGWWPPAARGTPGLWRRQTKSAKIRPSATIICHYGWHRHHSGTRQGNPQNIMREVLTRHTTANKTQTTELNQSSPSFNGLFSPIRSSPRRSCLSHSGRLHDNPNSQLIDRSAK